MAADERTQGSTHSRAGWTRCRSCRRRFSSGAGRSAARCRAREDEECVVGTRDEEVADGVLRPSHPWKSTTRRMALRAVMVARYRGFLAEAQCVPWLEVEGVARLGSKLVFGLPSCMMLYLL